MHADERSPKALGPFRQAVARHHAANLTPNTYVLAIALQFA